MRTRYRFAGIFPLLVSAFLESVPQFTYPSNTTLLGIVDNWRGLHMESLAAFFVSVLTQYHDAGGQSQAVSRLILKFYDHGLQRPHMESLAALRVLRKSKSVPRGPSRIDYSMIPQISVQTNVNVPWGSCYSIGQPSGISFAARAASIAAAASPVTQPRQMSALPFSHHSAASFVLASLFSFSHAATSR